MEIAYSVLSVEAFKFSNFQNFLIFEAKHKKRNFKKGLTVTLEVKKFLRLLEKFAIKIGS